MASSSPSRVRATAYELVFTPLHQGQSFAFPCNEKGAVELNDLTERTRNDYLLVRALVGRDFQAPRVVPRTEAERTDASSVFDETGLEQEGARAARTGRSWQSNPYLRGENMPQTTKETVREWSRKHDAWQRGFEAPRKPDALPKQTLSAELIATVIERRLRWLPEVRAELERDRYSVVRVELPRRHATDANGRSWDVDSFECGSLEPGICATAFRIQVDRIRDLYDLA